MFKWLYGPMLYPKADRMGTYASALAYSVVLSLVPFLVVTFAVGLQITSQLALKNDAYASGYAQVLKEILPMENPKDTARIFSAVQNSTNPKSKSGIIAVAISLGLAVYTSFNLMDQIFRTILFIFDDPRRPQEWTWRMMAKTFALLAIWMCLLLLISISAVGATGLRALLDQFIFTSLSKVLVTGLQIAIIISALFWTFYLTYDLVPTRSYKRRFLMEGSLLASIGWIACSLIFATVVPKLLKTSAAYAALGSVVGILLWAQACAWSIILGACWIVRFSPKGK
jgi:inner membrane protein YhjD